MRQLNTIYIFGWTKWKGFAKESCRMLRLHNEKNPKARAVSIVKNFIALVRFPLTLVIFINSSFWMDKFRSVARPLANWLHWRSWSACSLLQRTLTKNVSKSCGKSLQSGAGALQTKRPGRPSFCWAWLELLNRPSSSPTSIFWSTLPSRIGQPWITGSFTMLV